MAIYSPARLRLLLVIFSLASFMASLDLFIVNVAFTAIGRGFQGQGLSNLSWILNGYAIVFAALLVPLGRLADRYSRKAGFVLGVTVFTAASLACAMASSLWMLVGFRVLQAAGAAAMVPTSLGLLLSVFPPERRTGAVRIWSASSALAAAAGPVVGGALVSASWRWVFAVNIPIGVVGIAAAVWAIPDSRDHATNKVPDLPGTVVLTAGVGLLALGLVKINEWPTVRTVAVIIVAVLALVAFWLRSLHHPAPVVEPSLLRVRAFAWSNVTALLFTSAFAANLLIAILWMQQVWGYSAIRTGLDIAPGPLMVPVFALVAGRLGSRIPVGLITSAGCLLCAAGVVIVVASLGQSPDYSTEFLPGWLVGGAGVGLALPTILSAAAADLPAYRFATGSAVVNMSRQVGTVLGISLLVAIMGTPSGYPAVHHAYVRTWLVVVVFMGVAALTAIPMTPRKTVLSTAPAQAADG
jgi:EmrB/QacA subfamily drug resistance transporter